MRRRLAPALVLVTGICSAACGSTDGKVTKSNFNALGPDAALVGSGGDAPLPVDGTGGADVGSGGSENGGGAGGAAGGAAQAGSGGESAAGGAAPGSGGKHPVVVDGGVAPGGDAGTCTSDGDCTSPTRFCDVTGGRCVACLSDKHCPMGQTCGVSDHACKFACHTSADCADPQPYCDTAHNECVACLSDTNCSSGTKNVCDPTTKACVECTKNADCSCLLLGQAPCCTSTNRCVCGLLVCL